MGEIRKEFLKSLAILISLIFIFSCSYNGKMVDPTPPPDMLLLMQARKMLDMGNINAAEGYVDKFVLLFPSHENYPYVLYLKGEIAFRKGELVTAYQYYRMAKRFIRDPALRARINRKMLLIENILHLKLLAVSYP